MLKILYVLFNFALNSIILGEINRNSTECVIEGFHEKLVENVESAAL